MQYSVVNYKTAKENIDFRYEAEFFLPKYIEYENILSKITTIKLCDCALFDNGRAFDSNEFSFDGDVYISKIGDVTQKRNYRSWEKVSRSHFDKLKAKYLKHNDILMTLTGDPPDVGKTQLIFNPPEKTLSWNQRVALIRLKKQENIVSPECLFVTLSTKYCREHIERWAKGIRQRNVGNPAVLNMCMPQFTLHFQSFLAEIVKKSFNLSDNSYHYYSQAEQTLLSELGFVDWKPKHQLSFVKNFSDTKSVDRIDADYFQPMYNELIEKVKQYRNGYRPLGDIAKIKDKNFVPKDDITYKYIELANISANGNINDFTEVEGKELPSRARRKVNTRDVIVSSIEGSLSSISLINGDLDNALCSTGFYVINSDTLNSETLLVLLKSPVGQLQLKKGCSGTILTAINNEEFNRVLLPNISASIQEEIRRNITEMYKAKLASKKLLDIAKRGVEMAIEKSEAEAEKWLIKEEQQIIKASLVSKS